MRIKIGGTVRDLIITDHARERGFQRISPSMAYCEELLLQSITAIEEKAPELFQDVHTVDIMDYNLGIFIGMHLSDSAARVQTIGRQGEIWPKSGHTVVKRHRNLNRMPEKIQWENRCK